MNTEYRVALHGRTWGIYQAGSLVEGGFFDRAAADAACAVYRGAASPPATPTQPRQATGGQATPPATPQRSPSPPQGSLFDPGKPLQGAVLRGRLYTPDQLRRYVEAGRAVFTIRANGTGTRFTFKASRPNEAEHAARQHGTGTAPRERPIWIALMNGPDNEKDYQFIGTLWPEDGGYRYAHSPKSKVSIAAESVKAVMWLARCYAMKKPEVIFTQAEIWHEGRCGRCGRRLTVPESIEHGFGPECSGLLGLR